MKKSWACYMAQHECVMISPYIFFSIIFKFSEKNYRLSFFYQGHFIGFVLPLDPFTAIVNPDMEK